MAAAATPPLLPLDAAGRARVRALAQSIACEIHPLNNLRVMRFLEREFSTPQVERDRWTRHWITEGLHALEVLLADNSSTGVFCDGDAPTIADVCLIPQVYNARRFGVDLAVAPGWYSDFHNDSSQSLRITGHGFGAWEATDNLRVVAGLIYLDRYDVNMLPAGGLVWTPADDKRFELIFPRPRLAWRFAEHPRAAHWSYLAAEFGGNQWAMQSATGADEVVVIRDYRLIAGWERKPADLGISWRLETGYVFGRTVQYYDSDTPTAEPGNTFMVRGGVWY